MTVHNELFDGVNPESLGQITGGSDLEPVHVS